MLDRWIQQKTKTIDAKSFSHLADLQQHWPKIASMLNGVNRRVEEAIPAGLCRCIREGDDGTARDEGSVSEGLMDSRDMNAFIEKIR